MAIQIARLLGAGKLIGVVSREEKRAYARSFGYDDILLQSDFADQVRIDVTEVLPLSLAGEAHRRIESRRNLGKLLLRTCSGA